MEDYSRAGIIGFYAAGNLVAGRKTGCILVLVLSAALLLSNPYGVKLLGIPCRLP